MLPEQRSMLFANDVSMLIDSGANPTVIPVDTDGRVRTLLKRALALLGTPYRWGGSTTDGFDCSGLVGYVFRSALGIELPRVSRQMAHSGEKRSEEHTSELQSLMRISYAVFCWKKQNTIQQYIKTYK